MLSIRSNSSSDMSLCFFSLLHMSEKTRKKDSQITLHYRLKKEVMSINVRKFYLWNKLKSFERHFTRSEENSKHKTSNQNIEHTSDIAEG